MGISFRQACKLPDEDTYRAMVSARNPKGSLMAFKDATVGIAGLGGLGSNIAMHLVRAGVGKLVLADFDVVDPSNLNRQNYYRRHIGRKKSEAVKEVLHDINPYTALETHDVYITADNLCEIFREADILVEAFDTAHCKAMLLDVWTALRPEIPVVCASGMAGIGPANALISRRLGKKAYLIGDLISEASETSGLLSSRVALAAAHQSHAVLRLLLGEEEV